MDDVQRALEKAAEAVGSANIDDDWDDIARAAVLAFLKEMPATDFDTFDVGQGQLWRIGKGWNLHTLAAAIEKEQT